MPKFTIEPWSSDPEKQKEQISKHVKALNESFKVEKEFVDVFCSDQPIMVKPEYIRSFIDKLSIAKKALEKINRVGTKFEGEPACAAQDCNCNEIAEEALDLLK